jgi:3-oxoacyl-[acyl-carrier-protein] synthase-3
MTARIRAIETAFPETALTNEQLAREYPDWTVEKIAQKTGIRERRIAAPGECSSDLAVRAGEALFRTGACRAEDIDYVLLCTQSPDYFLPTTACLVQHRLGIPTRAGALDFNLGCSGYVYGLGLAKGLVETGQARNVLLLTAETYSKYIDPADRGVRTIFGDAAAATLIDGAEASEPTIGPFVFGTDGAGAQNLIVKGGGMREREAATPLFMNGAEILNFTLQVVPKTVNELLARAGLTMDGVDLFVFHQANQYMLEHLRKKLRVPEEKFPIVLDKIGNTVSSTIPITLQCAAAQGRLKPGMTAMLVGFGVGYSWGAAIIRWADAAA